MLSLCLWLLCAMPAWADADEPDTEHPTLCEVSLVDDRAKFYFPILDADEWRWYRKESQPEALEYVWEVMIPAEKPDFIFGIYLPKPIKGEQREGSLQQILDTASWNAIKLVPDTGKGPTSQPLPNIKLGVGLEDGGVVLTLLDKASTEQVLGSRPKTALFNLLHPDEVYTTSCVAPISYLTSGAKAGPARGVSKQSSWELMLP
jgi:hypothetical protein